MGYNFATYSILALSITCFILNDASSQEAPKPDTPSVQISTSPTTPNSTVPQVNASRPQSEIKNIKLKPNGKIDIKLIAVVPRTEKYSKEQCKASFPEALTIGVWQSILKLDDGNSALITYRRDQIQDGMVHVHGGGNWKGEREGPFQFHISGFIKDKVFHGISVDKKCVMMFSFTPHTGTLQYIHQDGTIISNKAIKKIIPTLERVKNNSTVLSPAK